MFTQERYAGIDFPHHVFGTRWTAIVKVVKNILKVVTRCGRSVTKV